MSGSPKSKADLNNPQDDSDADAFAVLSALIIVAATLVFYLTH